MLTFLVLRTWSIAMLLRSLGSLTTWHVATLLRSLVWVGVGWGGGHVSVPGTSYMIYCHVAKISGIAHYVTCCYAAEISSVGWGGLGWGGMLTFLVLRTWSIAMLLRSLGSLTRDMLLRTHVWSIHVWCTWCLPDLSKINRFCIHFFWPKFSFPKSSEEHFIL